MSYYKYDGTLAGATAQPVNVFGGSATLTGTSSADEFWGGTDSAGRLMVGGAGDDTYYISSLSSDRVEELAGGGNDTVFAWNNIKLSNYANVENVTSAGDKCYAFGNSADNIVSGQAGSQQLYGAGGQDVLVGGAGADTFIVVKGEGNDVIQDFSASEGDVIRLQAGIGSFADLQARMTQVGADTKIDLGGGDGLILRNVTATSLTASNFHIGVDTAKLGAITFHDEFSSSLSLWDAESNPTGTWRADYGYSGSQGQNSYTLASNGEKQIYISPYFRDHNGDFDTPFVSNGDGTLSIVAKASSSSEIFGYQYTSGLITTLPSFAQQYGYFEMRADLPEADGAWPAFWLLPADGSWPPELDVLETVADKSLAFTTAHWQDGSGTHQQLGQSSLVLDNASGFHTYGLLWTASDLTWYVDGTEVFHMATPAGMNKPMYLLANLALGGWGGAVDPADYPAEMKIDYIRAYALADGSTSTTGTGGGTVVSTGGGTSTGGTSTGGTSTGGTSTGGSTTGGTTTSGGTSSGGTSSGGVGSGSTTAGQTLSASEHGGTLQGGTGDDVIHGGSGQDYLRGAEGADQIDGGDGFDDINGNQGNDTLSGGVGGDWVVGGRDDDRLSGDEGADIVYGNMGADWADGGAGNDIVRGGQDNDTILGGDGADWLSGDKGSDTITGGAGADVFHSWSEAGVDYVTDFNGAEGDRVQLDAGTHYTVAASGADTVITMDGGAQVVLAGVSFSAFQAGWIFEA